MAADCTDEKYEIPEFFIIFPKKKERRNMWRGVVKYSIHDTHSSCARGHKILCWRNIENFLALSLSR